MAAGWLHLAAAASDLSPAQLSYAMAGIAASVLVCCCSTYAPQSHPHKLEPSKAWYNEASRPAVIPPGGCAVLLQCWATGASQHAPPQTDAMP